MEYKVMIRQFDGKATAKGRVRAVPYTIDFGDNDYCIPAFVGRRICLDTAIGTA